MYNEVMVEVRKVFPKKVIQTSWYYLYNGFNDAAEFHIDPCELLPEGYHYHGKGQCSWEIKAYGWQAALEIIERRKEVGNEQ